MKMRPYSEDAGYCLTCQGSVTVKHYPSTWDHPYDAVYRCENCGEVEPDDVTKIHPDDWPDENEDSPPLR
jgi:uncharacterized Zn finger protein